MPGSTRSPDNPDHKPKERGPGSYDDPNVPNNAEIPGDRARHGPAVYPTNFDDPDGYWAPAWQGSWAWTPGEPPDDLVDEYGYDTLTDPTKTPNGTKNPYYDEDPAPPDVVPPELEQVWDTAPHIPGEDVDIKGGGGGGDGDSPPPVHEPYTVSPGSIRDAENEILVETQRQVNHYESFKDYVNSTKHWIFGFDSADDTEPYDTRAGRQTPVDTNHKVTNKMVAIQDNALLAVADTIVLAGQFVALLNNGAQGYARADLNSFMPDADNSPGGSGNGDTSQ